MKMYFTRHIKDPQHVPIILFKSLWEELYKYIYENT